MMVHPARPPIAAHSLYFRRPITCLSVDGVADPGFLARVVGELARRGIVPLTVHALRVPEQEDLVVVDMQLEAIAQPEAEILAECLRRLPVVSRVLLCQAETTIRMDHQSFDAAPLSPLAKRCQTLPAIAASALHPGITG